MAVTENRLPKPLSSDFCHGLLGLLSIAATAYFALRYSERKAPRMQSMTENKIAVSQDAAQDIEVRYKDVKVDRVTTTLVWLWNDGRKPILRADLLPNQPLVVELADPAGQLVVLDVAVRSVSRPGI